jgi:signal peptidase I
MPDSDTTPTVDVVQRPLSPIAMALVGFALLAVIAGASIVHLPGSLGAPPAEKLHIMQASASSMEPTLRRGERFLADTDYYVSHRPSRGDVVIYRKPKRAAAQGVKRIAAIGGDRVAVAGGIAIVNGVPADEPYAKVGDASSRFNNTAETVVPEGYVFVLGDNRSNSEDSRMTGHGLLPVSNILGLATRIVWSPDVHRIGTWIGTPAGR